jgi:hypothetical protein
MYQNVPLCTLKFSLPKQYAPMIYMALYVMFLMRADPLQGPKNGTRLTARCHFTGPKIVSISRAQNSLDFQGPTPCHLPS